MAQSVMHTSGQGRRCEAERGKQGKNITTASCSWELERTFPTSLLSTLQTDKPYSSEAQQRSRSISLPKNICLLIITHYQLKQFHNEAMRPNEVDVIIG